MAYEPVKIQYRQSSPFLATFDFFDFVVGLGYKNFYLAALRNSAGAQYLITTDSTLIGDAATYRYGGGSTLEQDFDITFNNPAQIAAADATISFSVNGVTSKTFDLTATIFHVTVGGVETQIGTGIAQQVSGALLVRKTFKFAMTRKQFGVGEKMRVTLDTISNDASARTFLDPSGKESLTETTTSRTIDSSFVFSIPFEVDI